MTYLGETVHDVEVLLSEEQEAIHRLETLDSGATEEMRDLVVLFQEAKQIQVSWSSLCFHVIEL